MLRLVSSVSTSLGRPFFFLFLLFWKRRCGFCGWRHFFGPIRLLFWFAFRLGENAFRSGITCFSCLCAVVRADAKIDFRRSLVFGQSLNRWQLRRSGNIFDLVVWVRIGFMWLRGTKLALLQERDTLSLDASLRGSGVRFILQLRRLEEIQAA